MGEPNNELPIHLIGSSCGEEQLKGVKGKQKGDWGQQRITRKKGTNCN